MLLELFFAYNLTRCKKQYRADEDKFGTDLWKRLEGAYDLCSALENQIQYAQKEGINVDKERLYLCAPRGIGMDHTPGCFMCAGPEGLYNNVSLYVKTKETGEAIVNLFKTGARLDFREFEPDYLQVKIGACKKHLFNLEWLVEAIVAQKNIPRYKSGSREIPGEFAISYNKILGAMQAVSLEVNPELTSPLSKSIEKKET